MRIIIQVDKDEYIAYKEMAAKSGWGDDANTMIKENLIDNSDLIYNANIQIIEPINSIVRDILRTL